MLAERPRIVVPRTMIRAAKPTIAFRVVGSIMPETSLGGRGGEMK